MIKKLPMDMLEITHAPADTYLLSFLLPHRDSWKWIASNFINISVHKQELWDEFYRYDMWSGCPYILESSLTYEIADMVVQNFAEFACRAIDKGYGIYISINRFPIKIYNTTATNLCHNPFIFGYDDKKAVFYVAEFYPKMHYSFSEISFSEIDEAFRMYPMVFEKPLHKKVRLIKFYEGDLYHFSACDLIEKLNEFLSSDNLYRKYHQGFYRTGFLLDSTRAEQFAFGLDYYVFLKEIIYTQAQVPIRPFQLLVLKNEISRFRIRYLRTEEIEISCENILHKLEEKTNILRNYILKLQATKTVSKDKLYRIIDEIRKLDEEFCMKLVVDLEQSLKDKR